MSDSGKAVFLSYASEDASAVARICDALRVAGVEVWFDVDELVGGDAWDQKIRQQIKECALFIPVISANTNARAEGYFRFEWKLAVDRSYLMADDAPFLFPVVIDDTTDATARVPDKFRALQWTRLNVKATPESLAFRVAQVLGSGAREASTAAPVRGVAAAKPRERSWMQNVGVIGGILIILGFAVRGGFGGRHVPEPKFATPASVAPASVAPASVATASVATASVATAPLSPARQLAEKARGLLDTIDSTADDFATAESLVKRALELDQTDGEIWAVSSRINSGYLSRGFERGSARLEAARSQAERAVKLAPDSAEAWLALGRGLWTIDFVRAEETLRHGLKLAPQNGRILLSLGSLFRRQARFDEALTFYEQAAALPETRALARYDQYLIHFFSRRFSEADRCLREAMSVSNTSNMVAGLALLEVSWRGRLPEATEVLRQAPVVTLSQPRMVLASVFVSLMARRGDQALKALERLPADYINDAWYTGPKALLQGLAHALEKKPEAARISWESGLTVVRRRLQENAGDAEAHLRLGELLAWTGQTEAALQEVRVINELRRGSLTDWTNSSARIHAALGRAEDAVPLLEEMCDRTVSFSWPVTPALLRLDPLWDKIRDDPRFQALCREPLTKSTPSP
ncbi:MAG: hypothetical protein RL077_399 [Verrucomicrobiota bacterium]